MQTINWENYLDVFPDRYTQRGPFDEFIEYTLNSILKNCHKIHALDVGGGKTGTQSLKHPQVKAWLADPFVKGCPDWMEENLGSIYPIGNWRYPDMSLAIARGSFNYLIGSESRTVCELLVPGGIFLFNTFINPKSGERPYINSKTNTKGIERYIDEGRKIRHQLIPENSNEIIEHTFYVYNKDHIELMFAEYEITFHDQGNSRYIAVRKQYAER